MKKISKLISTMTLVCMLLGQGLGFSVNAAARTGSTQALETKESYIPFELVSGLNPALEIFINDKDMVIDFNTRKSSVVELRIKAAALFSKGDYPTSLRLDLYEYDQAGNKVFISKVHSTVFNKKQADNLAIEADTGYFAIDYKTIYLDLYDAQGKLLNTYKKEIEARNITFQDFTEDTVLEAADCSGERFDDCQLKYFLEHVNFEAIPKVNPATEVTKKADGSYTVTIPIAKRRVEVERGINVKDRDIQVSDETGTAEYGDGSSRLDFGIADNQKATWSYHPDTQTVGLSFNDATFSDVYTITQTGRVGIGVSNPEAWLHINKPNDDKQYPPLLITPSSLITNVKDGALEYDGAHVYFTIAGQRQELLSHGNITVDPSTGKISPSSLSPEVVLTSASQTVSNKVMVNTRFEGTIQIATNASDKYVLISDKNGMATWGVPNNLGGATSSSIDATGITIGNNLLSNASYATTIGKGNSTTDKLKNNIANSLMIGIDSNISTMFVQGAAGGNSLGKVGIGTINPLYLLDVNGSMHADTIDSSGFSGNGSGLTHLNGSALDLGVVSASHGGTSVANIGGTMTFGANDIVFTGGDTTFTATGITNVTLPTTGTLATLAGTETLTNKTIRSPFISNPTVNGHSSFADSTTFNGSILTRTALTINGTTIINAITTINAATNFNATTTINGNLVISDGTEANGYILISDINGNSSWSSAADALRQANLPLDVLKDAMSDYSNIFVGNGTGLTLNGGTYNTVFGNEAAKSITNGDANIAMGYNSIYHLTNGNANVALGHRALFNGTTANGNITIGYQAGDNITTGSRNIILGYEIDAPNATADDQLNIGNAIYSNLATGNVGIGVTNPANFKLEVAGNIGPDANGTRDLGSTGARFRRAYINDATITNTVTATNLNGTTANLTTINSTTVNNTGTVSTAKLLATGSVNGATANFTTGNITTVNATTGNITTANTTTVNASGTVNGANFDGNFTNGSILFSNPNGVISQNNSKLFWDRSNDRLGINTTAPSTDLDINGGLRVRGSSPQANFVLSAVDSTGLTTWTDISTILTNGGAFLNALNDAISDNTSNLFLGNGSGLTNAGEYNTGVGILALNANTAGNGNTAMGYRAVNPNTTGNFNTGFGAYTLNGNTTGNGNVALGYRAGYNITTGSRNIILGYGVNAVSPTADDQLNIGNAIYSNLATGNVGIGVTNPANFKLEVAGNIGPDANGTRDLGSTGARFRRAYINDATITNTVTATNFNGTTVNSTTIANSGTISTAKLLASGSVNGATANFTTGNITTVNATTINGATIDGSFTNGSILFSNAAGVLSQNNSQFFWDTNNNRLGLGNNSPTATLDVTGTIKASAQVNGVTANFTTINNTGTISTAKLLATGSVNGATANFTTSNITTVNATTGNITTANTTTVNASGTVNGANFDGNFTNGSILFSNPNGVISQNNSKLFWDRSNDRLGINTTAPSTDLDINGGLRVRGSSPQANFVLSAVDSTGLTTWTDISTILTNGGAFLNALNDAISDNTSNLFLGNGSGLTNAGEYNTGVGILALNANTAGNGNTAMGYRAVNPNTTGNFNTGFGAYTLNGNTTGNGNVALGYRAGYNITTGSRNIILGYGVNAVSPTADDQLNIGNTIYSNLATDDVAIGTSTLDGAFTVNQTDAADIFNLQDAGSTVFTVIDGGNVGIGVNAPTSKLDIGGGTKTYIDGTNDVLISDDLEVDDTIWASTINGDTGYFDTLYAHTFAGTLSLDNGTAALPSHGFTHDNGTGMYMDAANRLGFSTNRTERLLIDSAGNIGIGVSNPNNFKLEVAGNIGPDANGTRDLGSTATRFRRAYINDATITNTVTATNFNGTTVNSTTIANSGTISTAKLLASGSVNGATANFTTGNITTVNATTINGATIDGSFTNGSILFSNAAGVLSQNNSQFFWNNNNNRLGLGNNSPTATLDVTGTIKASAQVNGVTANFTTINNTGTISTAKLLATGSVNGATANFITGNITTINATTGNITTANTTTVNASGTVNGASFDGNFTNGSILFSNPNGVISQNNSKLFWDRSNNRLGINTTAPSTDLDINGGLRVRGSNPAANYVLSAVDSTGLTTWTDISTILTNGGAFLNALNDAISDNTSNLFLGNGSGLTNAGEYNTGVGILALNANTAGNGNTAMGYRAVNPNTTGNFNTGFGAYTLNGNTTGNGNVALGYRAGYNITTGSRNIILGYGVNAVSPTADDQLNIGNAIYSNLATDDVAIGTSTLDGAFTVNQTDAADIFNLQDAGSTVFTVIDGGNVGIGVNAPTSKLDIGGGTKTYIDGTNDVLISDDLEVDDTIWANTVNGNYGYFDVLYATIFAGTLSLDNGTASRPSHSFTHDNGTGMYMDANGRLAFSTSETERLLISPTGNIGIGVTNPANFKLEVAGNIGPSVDSTYNLGSSSIRWANAYADNFNGATANITTINTTTVNSTTIANSGTISTAKLLASGSVNGATANMSGSAHIAGTVNGGLFDGDFTNGSILFSNAAGVLSQNNSQFFWDNNNNRLGIGTTTPGTSVTINKPTSIANQKLLSATINGNEIAVIQEGIGGNYGGTLSLKDGLGGAGYLRMRYDAGYPKLESSTTSLTFIGSNVQQRLTNTYIDFLISGQTPLILSNPGAAALITATGTSTQGLVVKGKAAQTANLTEWQNGGSVVKSFIDNGGRMAINKSTRSSGAMLDVNGSIFTTGFKMSGSNPQANYVLSAVDSTGLTTWTDISTILTNGGAFLNALNDAISDNTSNLFLGNGSGLTNAGEYNTGVGILALNSNTAGNGNTAMGYRAVNPNTTGNFNTGFGAFTLNGNTTGNGNVALGYRAGYNITTGSRNITLGYGVNAVSPTADDQLNIGNAIYSNLATDDVAIGTSTLDGAFTVNQTDAADIFNLQDAGSTVFTVIDGGNVGIGVNAPTSKLDIGGGTKTYIDGVNDVLISDDLEVDDTIWANTINGSYGYFNVLYATIFAGSLSLDNGTASRPSHSFTHDNGTGMYMDANGRLAFSTSETERLLISPTGNIGIGVTNPANFKLEVAGNIGPSVDSTYNLGSSSIRWANAYADNFNGATANITTINTTTLNSTTIANSGTISTAKLLATGSVNGATANMSGSAHIAGTVNGGLFDGDFTNGSILFSNATGVLSQDNSNFFWDRSNNRLGLGLTDPDARLEITPSLASEVALHIKAALAQATAIFKITDSSDATLISFGVNGSTVFNENSLADADFRIEGDSNASLMFVDASTDRVGIKTNAPNSTLHVAGSMALPIISKNTNYTVTENDYTILSNASGGVITITLPAAAGIPGRVYIIKKTDGSANQVIIDANGAETIDGSTTYNLTVQHEAIQIQTDGSNWYIL